MTFAEPEETMNIHTAEGSKVVFAFPENGYEGEQESIKKYMEVGDVFTVEFVDIGQSYTNVYLKEITERGFNSVFFANVNDSVTEKFNVCVDDDCVNILDFISDTIREDMFEDYEVTVTIKKINRIEDEV